MNIKSLLLGSAAALAAVSGAQAADAIVAAAPEPMEYVRVCDAFGTGYFYIPGTETCLQISGTVRFQVDFGNDTYDNGTITDDWDAKTLAWVNFSAKSDTELGVLESYITFEIDTSEDGSGAVTYADAAYIALGGFQAGWIYNWWDAGIAGETDDLHSDSQFTSINYTYAADAFSVGLSLDELEGTTYHDLGLSGIVSASMGPASLTVVGGYDFRADEGAVRAILTADIGPGKFGIGGYYSSGVNVYGDEAEWAIAASYALKATEKFTITPGIQYWDNTAVGGAFTGGDMLKYGVTLDYYPVENLLTRVSLQYDDVSEDVYGYFRLQRDF